jgi:hypothetical protein
MIRRAREEVKTLMKAGLIPPLPKA